MTRQKQQHQDDRKPTRDKSRRPQGPRRTAEWFSLGLSILIVLGAAGFLVHEALGPDRPVIPLSTRVLTDQARRVEGGYEVPVEVRNKGAQTVHNLQVQVRFTNANGEQESMDYVIDYLGEDSSEKVYVHIDRPPTEAQVEVRPVVFRLE